MTNTKVLAFLKGELSRAKSMAAWCDNKGQVHGWHRTVNGFEAAIRIVESTIKRRKKPTAQNQ